MTLRWENVNTKERFGGERGGYNRFSAEVLNLKTFVIQKLVESGQQDNCFSAVLMNVWDT